MRRVCTAEFLNVTVKISSDFFFLFYWEGKGSFEFFGTNVK